MPLDTNIALQVRPFQMESPVNAMSKMYELQGAQQANQLNSMKMAEYERARVEEEGLRNFLAGADIKAPQTRAELTTRFGKTGLGYAKALSDQETAALEQKSKQLKFAGDLAEQAGRIYGTVTDEASWQRARPKLAALGGDASALPTTYDPAYVQSELAQAISAKDRMEQHFAQQDLSGSVQTLAMPKYALPGAPANAMVVPGSTVNKTPLSAEIEAQKMRIANAGASRQVTNVNTQIPASEEAQKEYMKEARVTFNTLKSAPSVLTNMEEAKKLIPSAKGFMGPGGEPMLKAASFLNNRLGTNIATEGITDATVLRSRLFTGVIENLRKLDAQPTQSQQQVLQDAIGNLGTDPNALPRVLDAFGDILREKVGSYNTEVKDAEARGVKFPYNPVIKLPGTKKPATDQIPGQSTPARTVTRTGTVGNRRVVEYSDGSVEYAN